VDLATNTVARIVELDTAGVGASSVFAYGNDIFIIADGSGSLLQYHPATGTFDQYEIGISAIGNSKWYSLRGGVLYAKLGSSIGSYNLQSHQVVDADIVTLTNLTGPAYFAMAAAYDTLNEQFYLTYSDFTTSGFCLVYDTTGARVDSFYTGIASEAIGLYYSPVITGVCEVANLQLNVYPNPVSDVLNISFNTTGIVQLSLKDLSGKIVLERSVSSNGAYHGQLSLANLAEGLYLLQITNGKESTTSKVIKL
jgi:hypothetical protein